jgi:hypothetical protein
MSRSSIMSLMLGRKQTTASASYKFQITPSASLVIADAYYDLSNAPAGFWAHVRSDGGDIRVYKQDGTTQVAREVAGFNYSGHTGQVFFSVSSDTSFYLVYGDNATEPAANSTYGKNAVWETSLKLVFHGENYNDSTANGVTASAGSSSLAAMKMGNGFQFSATGVSQITTSYSGALNDLTFMCWVKSTGAGDGNARVIDKDFTFGFSFSKNTETGTYRMHILGTPCYPSGAYADGTTFHVVGRRSGSTGSLFSNGGDKQDIACSAAATNTKALDIGWLTGSTRGFIGLADEVRIYSRALSDAEIAQHYSNQNAPASFWTTGSEGTV